MSLKGSRRGIRSVARGALRAGAWLGAATLAAGTVQAQQSAGPESDEQDGSREVIDVVGHRLEQGLGTRYTAPLLETPQTITLVPREIMDQQNLLTMREVLSTLPGITFTAGEGGGGYGDGVNLRGYTASNDISTDGVRDSAQYSRTDPFNLEQLELVSGANSVYTGAGSVGGSINLVTKTPRGTEDTVLDIAGGSDSYGRLTLDSELEVGDVADFRLNLMTHENDVPGRDVESFKRWGIAPSVAFGGDSDTRFTLSYLHQEDDNVPQYGVPYALGAFNDGPLPGVPTSAYYGYANLDTQEIGVDALTAIMTHDFTGNFSLRNLTRWQQVDQFSFVDQPQGTWCVETGVNPWTGAACAAPGTFVPNRGGTVRDTNNEILVNQTDFTVEFATGKVQHTLVTGFSLSNETYHRENGNGLRNPLGATPNPVLPTMSITDPDHFYTGPVNLIMTQVADGEVKNQAAYVFDRLQLTERFEINAGLRYEHNDAFSTLGNITSALSGAAGSARDRANPGRREYRRLGLVSGRLRLQARRELEHLRRAGQLRDAVASLGQRYLRHRDDLQCRSRGSRDVRDRRQGRLERAVVADCRGVSQRAQPVQGALGRRGDSGAAARRQFARRRYRARRGGHDRHEVVGVRELHVSRQRSRAERFGPGAGRRHDRHPGGRPVAEYARAFGKRVDDVSNLRCVLDRLRRDVPG